MNGLRLSAYGVLIAAAGCAPAAVESAKAPAPAAPAIPAEAQGWAGGGRFVALERDGKTEVYEAATGVKVATVSGKRPELCAEGRWLLTDAGVLHDLRAQKAYPLPGKAAGEPRWSPARDAIAVALDVAGATDIFLLELGAHEPRLHKLTAAGGFAPRWIGRNRLAYEAARPDGGFGMFIREKGGLGPEKPFWSEDKNAAPSYRYSTQA